MDFVSKKYVPQKPVKPKTKPKKHKKSCEQGSWSSRPSSSGSITLPPAFEQKLYIAVCNNKTNKKGYLKFQRFDYIHVLEDSNEEWWFARSTRTLQEGFVPKNYIVAISESEKWFFGRINTSDANNMLMHADLPKGAFMVKANSRLTLVVREVKEAREPRIMDYYIAQDEDTGRFYINKKIKFPTIQDLIMYYSTHDVEYACCKLTSPCPRDIMFFDEYKIPRHELSFEEDQKLGVGRYIELMMDKMKNRRCIPFQYMDICKVDAKLAVGPKFSEVWKGMWMGTPCAIRIMKADTCLMHTFDVKASDLIKLRHEKLVQFYGVCIDREPFYIVTELMTNGTLLEYLQRDSNADLPLQHLVDIAAQVAEGMHYLEQWNIVHGSLAARNVLMAENNSVKISDYSLARMIVAPDELEDKYGSCRGYCAYHWMALEVIYFGIFSVKSDIWSFGMLLMELVTKGQRLYRFIGPYFDLIEHLYNGFRTSRPRNCPYSLYGIMDQCWLKDPVERPTFEFLYHYLDDYDVAAESNYVKVYRRR